ncbi:MAG: glycosyl transferase family 2 [Anaerolineaceae bacterium]|nr:glycosyl transferase family 2 [Anaerolineaceae bacterium]
MVMATPERFQRAVNTHSPTLMNVSIIIPALNAYHTLPACLQACQSQVLPAGVQLEIILVDDGSTDSTQEIARAAGVQLVQHQTQRGAAAARNSGLAVAQGEIILFTDADCAPQPNWVAKMIRPFQDPTVHGCKGIYATNQPELVARFVQIEYEDKYDLLRTQPAIDFIDTYSAGYRADLLKAAGGFDEAIHYVEDQELSFRLAAAGHKMVFQETAVVFHQHSNSLPRYFRKKVMIGYWKAQIMRRYPERVIKDSHTPQVLKLQMALVALSLGTLATAALFPVAFVVTFLMLGLFLLTTLPFLQKAWHKDRSVCWASPWLLFCRALALGIGYAWGLVQPLAKT